VAPADIEAVLCFIVEPEQLEIELSAAPSEEEAAPPADSREATPVPDPVQTPAPHRAEGPAQSAVQNTAQGATAPGTQNSESSSIRVPVTKVDQIINLVGELIITQSMLNQVSGQLDGFAHGALVNGLN